MFFLTESKREVFLFPPWRHFTGFARCLVPRVSGGAEWRLMYGTSIWTPCSLTDWRIVIVCTVLYCTVLYCTDVWDIYLDTSLTHRLTYRNCHICHAQEVEFSNSDIDIQNIQVPHKLPPKSIWLWGPLKCTTSNCNPVHVFLHFGTFGLGVLQLILASK